MAILISPPAHANNGLRADNRYVISSSELAQGEEGKTIESRIKAVMKKVAEKYGVDDVIAEVKAESYRHVPFADSATIRVRFLAATPMLPRSFNFEVEEE